MIMLRIVNPYVVLTTCQAATVLTYSWPMNKEEDRGVNLLLHSQKSLYKYSISFLTQVPQLVMAEPGFKLLKCYRFLKMAEVLGVWF